MHDDCADRDRQSFFPVVASDYALNARGASIALRLQPSCSQVDGIDDYWPCTEVSRHPGPCARTLFSSIRAVTLRGIQDSFVSASEAASHRYLRSTVSFVSLVSLYFLYFSDLIFLVSVLLCL